MYSSYSSLNFDMVLSVGNSSDLFNLCSLSVGSCMFALLCTYPVITINTVN